MILLVSVNMLKVKVMGWLLRFSFALSLLVLYDLDLEMRR